MPKKTAKKPNPQDATLRNIRALKKKVVEIDAALVALKAKGAELERRVSALEKRRRR